MSKLILKQNNNKENLFINVLNQLCRYEIYKQINSNQEKMDQFNKSNFPTKCEQKSVQVEFRPYLSQYINVSLDEKQPMCKFDTLKKSSIKYNIEIEHYLPKEDPYPEITFQYTDNGYIKIIHK